MYHCHCVTIAILKCRTQSIIVVNIIIIIIDAVVVDVQGVVVVDRGNRACLHVSKHVDDGSHFRVVEVELWCNGDICRSICGLFVRSGV